MQLTNILLCTPFFLSISKFLLVCLPIPRRSQAQECSSFVGSQKHSDNINPVLILGYTKEPFETQTGYKIISANKEKKKKKKKKKERTKNKRNCHGE